METGFAEKCSAADPRKVLSESERSERVKEENEREKNEQELHLFANSKEDGGPRRERHSTCRHMACMAHRTTPLEDITKKRRGMITY